MLQIKRLYNIMALALKKAEECMNEHDFERMRNLDDAYETALTEELKRRFPDMFDKNTRNISEASEWHLGNSSLVEDLNVYLRESDNKEELVFLQVSRFFSGRNILREYSSGSGAVLFSMFE